jgi:transposase
MLRVREIARDRREAERGTDPVEDPGPRATGRARHRDPRNASGHPRAWLKEPKFHDERDRLLRQRVLHIDALGERKAILEPLLAGLALEDERAHWLMIIPGARWYLAMYILGEVGTITRFDSVDAFKKYSACCPREQSTGGRQDPYGVVQHGHKGLKWAFGQVADYPRTEEGNPIREAYEARLGKTGSHGSGMAVARREVCELVYNLLMVEEPCRWARESLSENKLSHARSTASG